jgi:hypothetical protein
MNNMGTNPMAMNESSNLIKSFLFFRLNMPKKFPKSPGTFIMPPPV